MQRYSFNQIEHNARKAARGAGVAWGLAEDTGRAVRWLETVGLNGVSTLVRLLDQIDSGTVALPALEPLKQSGRWRGDGPGATLLAGAAIADCIVAGNTVCFTKDQNQTLRIENLQWPLLCVGFAGAAVGQSLNRAWLDIDDARMAITETGAALQGSQSAIQITEGSVTVSLKSPASFHADIRLPMQQENATSMTAVDLHDWQSLERFAYRTYVPASEASRLGGAGAGTLDND